MEFPKKIYLQEDTTTDLYEGIWPGWFETRAKDTDIEYIHSDVFVEKALKWYCLDCECNDNCKDTKCFFYREYERYLKGETNALPPKFADRILNEDGSTSDNWRYRHFTSKMQDAFIKKATEWLKENANHYIEIKDGALQLKSSLRVEFKKAMKI